ncbi:MAG: hypothetical protein J1F39_02665 [Clostridiales bacterium]|nr:hypothetical protein [Clostridiales bacterium]
MARQSVFTEMETSVGKRVKEVGTELHEQAVREKRNEFNTRIDAIADKIIEFRERNAEEYLIEMLTTFLDVALDMRDLMDALEATSQGMQCIATAVGFIDEMLEFNMGMFEVSLNHNYGFWQRLKEKRRIRKAIRNNAGRMKMVVYNMTGQLRFAQELVGEMKNVTVQLKKATGKKNKKGEPSGGKAESYVQQRLSKRGGETTTESNGGASTATPPPAAPSGDLDSIDDIL